MTSIEIHTSIAGYLSDTTNPYYERTMVTLHLSSTTKFDRVRYYHLGFHSSGVGKRDIRRRGDVYRYTGLLDPMVDAQVDISPFKLYLKNAGDSLVAVHVRLPDGTARCNMTILQEKHQPKEPKVVDDFVQYQGIYYAYAAMNCLQTLRIEELKGDSNENATQTT